MEKVSVRQFPYRSSDTGGAYIWERWKGKDMQQQKGELLRTM